MLVFNLGLYVLPWGLLAFNPNLETGLLVLLSLFPRFLADVVSGYGWRLFILHPVSILAWTGISLQSVLWYGAGRVRWKGRAYDLRQTSKSAESVSLPETAELPRRKRSS